MTGQILAGGGSRFDDYVLELGGPKICSVPMATAYPRPCACRSTNRSRIAQRPAMSSSTPWPCGEVRARTTTSRSAAVRSIASSSTTAFPTGYAADDGVALHFVGIELFEVVATTPAAAYRVELDSPLAKPRNTSGAGEVEPRDEDARHAVVVVLFRMHETADLWCSSVMEQVARQHLRLAQGYPVRITQPPASVARVRNRSSAVHQTAPLVA